MMDKFFEEVEEPVSPNGQYFNSSVICAYIFAFLEFDIPFDNPLTIIPLIKDIFIPINPRFSSIMVKDKDGKMRWKKVEVKLEEHVKFPKFAETINSSQVELYDNYLSDYVTAVFIERTPQDKPLWEIHYINYPTTNAASTMIFKLHHALGDGYSLMGALLSCLQRADNPSLPLTFPSRTELDSKYTMKSLFKNLYIDISSIFSSISDFGSSIIKTRLIPDDITPIRSGYEEIDSRPVILSNISFSLDQIKEIKSNLGVTINDVVCGMIFYGLRLYMEELNEKTKTSNSTALVLLNTRNIGGYKSLKEMQKPESKGLWGNKISFLQIPIPKPNQSGILNPLEFVWEAGEVIKRKKNSFSVHLIGLLMDLEMKLRGPEAVSKTLHDTMVNTSVIITNLVGPVEKMTLANNPVNGLYFNISGGPQDIEIAIMSYVKVLRVTMKTVKGFIDEQKLKFCLEKAFEVIFKESMKIPEISTKN